MSAPKCRLDKVPTVCSKRDKTKQVAQFFLDDMPKPYVCFDCRGEELKDVKVIDVNIFRLPGKGETR